MDSGPAQARIAAEWLRRSGVEYTSASITADLTHRLLQVGCSPDLIRAGLVIVDDELTHAELALVVARAAGGAGGPTIVRERLALERRPELPLEDDLLRYVLGPFVIGETLAVRIFGAMREGCTVGAPRAALDRILVDEVRHRDFAWSLLEWLLRASPRAEALQARCAVEAPALLREWAARFDRDALDSGDASDPSALSGPSGSSGPSGPSEPGGEVDDVGALERAWGLLGPRTSRRIFLECRERDLRPRFARLGVAIDDA